MTQQWFQYAVVKITNKFEAEYVSIYNNPNDAVHYEYSGVKGRLLSYHVQAIVGADHYGVRIQEPNSSNREGFVEYDKIPFDALHGYNYNRKGESNFYQ